MVQHDPIFELSVVGTRLALKEREKIIKLAFLAFKRDVLMAGRQTREHQKHELEKFKLNPKTAPPIREAESRLERLKKDAADHIRIRAYTFGTMLLRLRGKHAPPLIRARLAELGDDTTSPRAAK